MDKLFKKKALLIFMSATLMIQGTFAYADDEEEDFSMQAGVGSETNLSENMIPNGSFDTGMRGYMLESKPGLEWVEDGYVKVSPTGRGSALSHNIKFVKGESYKISVKLKSLERTSNVSIYARFYDGGILRLASDIPMSPDRWRTFEGTFSFGGKDSLNQDVSGLAYVMLQFEKDEDITNYMIDDFCIQSYQNVENIAQKEVVLTPQKEMTTYSFNDTKGHWAENTITYMGDEGVMKGLSEGEFAPDKTLSRAEFITMLVNAADFDLEKYLGGFADINNDDWYADAVQTAKAKGIFSEGEVFKGNEPVKREDACVWLVNTVSALGYEKSDEGKISFEDESEISEQAREYVKKAVKAGLIYGDEKGLFNPNKSLTRAEGAELIKRLIEFERQYTYYVNPKSGSDQNDGTKQRPLKTVDGAKERLRSVNKDMDRNIYVYLADGEYAIDKPIEFDERDSGKNGYKIYYCAQTSEAEPAVSGGRHISGWRMDNVEKNIYKTYVGKDLRFRQLYINGMRAVRAKKNVDFEDYICDKSDETGGFYTYDDTLSKVADIENVEFHITAEWYWVNAGLDSVELMDDGRYRINVDKPMWDILAGKSRGWRVMELGNSYSFLDQPGEWFYDRYDGYVYYIPRPYEIMADVDAVIPEQLDLMTIKGSSVDNFVQSIGFRGVDFKYSTWDRVVEEKANLSAQDDLIDDENGGFRKHRMTPAAVSLEFAAHISFEDCKFSKIGERGLLFLDGTRYSKIQGCEFYDISSSAMQIGRYEYDSANPVDTRRLVTGNTITDNYVHSVSNEFRGAGAISAAYPNNCEFSHNEIFDVPYVGYHVGYGWQLTISSVYKDTVITDNYIHGSMRSVYDGGGIYVLGRTGGTPENPIRIERNYIHDQTNTMDLDSPNYRYKSVGLYSDRGTSHTKWTHNVFDVSDSEGLFNNFMSYDVHNLGVVYDENFVSADYQYVSTNPEIVQIYNTMVDPEAKWNDTAQSVIRNSGIRAPYIDNFKVDIQQIKLNYKDIYGDIGEEYQIECIGMGRKKQEYQLSPDKIYYTTTDESIASVDENGLIKLEGQGVATVSVWYTYDEYLMKEDIQIRSGDEVVGLVVSGVPDSLSSRVTAQLGVKGKTFFEDEISADLVTWENKSEDIVSINEDGVITPLDKDKGGKVTIIANAKFGEKTVSKEISFEVVAYNYGSGEGFDIGAFSQMRLMKNPSNLSIVGSTKLDETDDKVTVKMAKSSFAYYPQALTNELVTFNMSVADGKKWSAVSLRGDKKESFLASGREYVLIFTGSNLELSRFVDGVRTGIYSSSVSNPLGGPVYPTEVFGDTTTHQVQFGAINTSEGVRLIVNIDGVNVFDFTDTTDGKITGKGYFKIYPNGSDLSFDKVK